MHRLVQARELGSGAADGRRLTKQSSRVGSQGHFIRVEELAKTTALANLQSDPTRDLFNWRGAQDAAAVGSPLVCSFANTQPLVGVVGDDGNINLLTSEPYQGVTKGLLRTHWRGHDNVIFDISWAGDDHKVVTASGDKHCLVWDVTRGQLLFSLSGHEGSVKSVCFLYKNDAIIASGGRDGAVCLWDTRITGCGGNGGVGPAHSIGAAHTLASAVPHQRKKRRRWPSVGTSTHAVTCVSFCPADENLLVTAGAVDGCVKYWDIRKLQYGAYNSAPEPLSCLAPPAEDGRRYGISSLSFDRTGSRLLVGSTNSLLRVYSGTRPLLSTPRTYYGHLSSAFYVKADFSPDGKYICSGSCDSNAYVWKVDRPGPPLAVLKGHSCDVTGISWSPTSFDVLASCSDDGSVRLWRRRGSKITPSSVVSGGVSRLPLGQQMTGEVTLRRPPASDQERPSATVRTFMKPATPTGHAPFTTRSQSVSPQQDRTAPTFPGAATGSVDTGSSTKVNNHPERCPTRSSVDELHSTLAALPSPIAESTGALTTSPPSQQLRTLHYFWGKTPEITRQAPPIRDGA